MTTNDAWSENGSDSTDSSAGNPGPVDGAAWGYPTTYPGYSGPQDSQGGYAPQSAHWQDPAGYPAGPVFASGYHPYQAAYPGTPWPAPPAPAPTRSSTTRRVLLGVGGAALAAGLVLSGVAIGNATESSGSTAAQGSSNPSSGIGGSGSGAYGGGTYGGGTSGGAYGGGSTGGGSAGSGSTGSAGTGQTSASVATATQIKGIVTVVSVLDYGTAESAGTGMILTSDGEILTNNHVIDGATSITVTDESTGRSYKASVVGDDPTDDIAVLKLSGASGLSTAAIGDSSSVSVGDSVVGVGNAGGTGTLTAAKGAVTALNQAITATDDSGQNAEKLHGLIEINADIIAGDSGGPLYNSSGKIIGIDTAGSTSNAGSTSSGISGAFTGGATSTTATAYSIPIDTALSIAKQIESGVRTSTIHIGPSAFLGVGISPNATAPTVVTITNGSPAANAGITAGSVITAVGSTSISTEDGLKTALEQYQPGQSVTITWQDSSGASHNASVTLASGPAD